MKFKSDYIFLGILGLMIVNALYQFAFNHFVLTTNTYVGILGWAVTLFFALKDFRFSKYATAILLILGVLNILNFSVEAASTRIVFGDESPHFEWPGLNPITFLILIIYYIVNRKSINRILLNFIRGTEAEREEAFQKKVAGYLRNFEKFTPAELENMYKNVKEYPPEAQKAILTLYLKRSQIR
jgi:hypothetical protein